MNSKYGADPRLRWPGHGSPADMVAAIPDPDGDPDKDLLVLRVPYNGRALVGGTCVVIGALDEALTLRDADGRRAVFADEDEAFRAVLGEPE